MELINLSYEPLGKLYSWIPNGLQADKIVFLPDACPGKSPLPTGTVVLTKQEDWRKFAISDCGCGMRLLKSTIDIKDLNLSRWDQLADQIRSNKGKLGDLGGGNHFLDAIAPYNDGPVYFLIHTGSRNESGLVDNLIDKPSLFDTEFNRIVNWAEGNRVAIQESLQSIFGSTEVVLDLPHNTYKILSDGSAVIRKGSVKINPGELTVIPSHMSGDVLLVKANDNINELLNSMSHGTGRKMSRSECKPLADSFDFNKLREQILFPSQIENASLRTEGPYAYRDLDECLMLISDYVKEVARFSVIAYMGHL